MVHTICGSQGSRRTPAFFAKKQSLHWELNPGPHSYQECALPLSYGGKWWRRLYQSLTTTVEEFLFPGRTPVPCHEKGSDLSIDEALSQRYSSTKRSDPLWIPSTCRCVSPGVIQSGWTTSAHEQKVRLLPYVKYRGIKFPTRFDGPELLYHSKTSFSSLYQRKSVVRLSKKETKKRDFLSKSRLFSVRKLLRSFYVVIYSRFKERTHSLNSSPSFSCSMPSSTMVFMYSRMFPQS